MYEGALVRQGEVTLWLSPAAKAGWGVPPSGRPGGQQRFSDLAVYTALTLRLVFHLPSRQTEGFVRSLLGVMCAGLDAPDHTTLSRRGQWLDVGMHNIPATESLITSSTGLSVVGEGEWAARNTAGVAYEEGRSSIWVSTGVIGALALTEPTVDDASVGIDLVAAAAAEVASVTADSTYGAVGLYEAAVGLIRSRDSFAKVGRGTEESSNRGALAHGPSRPVARLSIRDSRPAALTD